MFELKKGDPENLAGKVLVYAHNIHCENCPDYPGLYASTNPLDIFSSPDENIKNLWNKTHDLIKEFEDKLESKIIPIFSKPYLLKNENEIKDIDGDVIYGGKINNPGSIFTLCKNLIEAYLINYEFQLDLKAGIDKIKIDDIITDTYKSYHKEETLKKRLYGFIGDLLDSINYKREKEVIKNINTLKEFSKGSSFYVDIMHLINVARSSHKNKLDIISAYINKIGKFPIINSAIKTENYETAAKLKADIKKIQSEIDIMLKM